jgi:hypothetical protein
MRFERYINFKSRRSTIKYRPRTCATITAIVAAFSMVVFCSTSVVAVERDFNVEEQAAINSFFIKCLCNTQVVILCVEKRLQYAASLPVILPLNFTHPVY